MFKIKKRAEKPKPTVLYNIIEDYSEFDAPGNVTACAMSLPEDLAAHDGKLQLLCISRVHPL